MPSPSAISENIRKRKRSQQGKVRKKANSKRGTINYYTAFATPAADDKKTQARS